MNFRIRKLHKTIASWCCPRITYQVVLC
jgi:hypothetical protein